MFALFRDPILEHTLLPNSLFSEFVNNSDGTVSFKTKDGGYISQEPNQHGHFGRATDIGPYEKFGGGSGIGIKTSWTRPQENDRIYSYFCCELPNVA